jgi:hypothetical protein
MAGEEADWNGSGAVLSGREEVGRRKFEFCEELTEPVDGFAFYFAILCFRKVIAWYFLKEMKFE